MTLIGNRLLINQLRERILREEKGSIVVKVVTITHVKSDETDSRKTKENKKT